MSGTATNSSFNLTTTNKDLPLSLRKNIKENEPIRDSHFEKLSQLSNDPKNTWKLEFEGDFKVFLEYEDRKDRLGHIFLDQYVGTVVEMCGNAANNAFVFGEFLKALTARTLVIRTTTVARESGAPYHRLSIEDGKLIVSFSHSDLWVNLSDISYLDISTIPVLGGKSSNNEAAYSGPDFSKDNKALSLVLRKNILESEEDIQKYIQEISATAGETFTVDIEVSKMIASGKIKDEYKDRLGSIASSYIQNIAYMLKKKLADDMTKEAFLETATKKKIVFGFKDTPRESGAPYQHIRFDDGALRVECAPEDLWVNVDDISYFDLDKLL